MAIKEVKICTAGECQGECLDCRLKAALAGNGAASACSEALSVTVP